MALGQKEWSLNSAFQALGRVFETCVRTLENRTQVIIHRCCHLAKSASPDQAISGTFLPPGPISEVRVSSWGMSYSVMTLFLGRHNSKSSGKGRVWSNYQTES